ncbi:SMP-30/gluconolactonase/LRE family protein [Herbiconiux sp. P15]|uniref:SMP-30/gluconolactonase/LRE family protein n=1 Tax=Herbiconiux liukaitaii TaxID=3342799 RepID=UPI0035BAA8E1
MKADQFTDPITFHGEGAVWHPGWGGLRVVDMLAGDVLALDEQGRVTRMPTGSSIAALVRPREAGGWIIATEREFTLWSAEGEKEWTSAAVTPVGVRLNEGGCAPDGSLLCGSMAYDQAPGAAALLRLGTDRAVETLFDGVTISNGLAFTADGSLLFYADTPTGRVDVFDVSDPQSHAALANRRPFVSIPEAAGAPDGLCVDSEGGIWVALYGGSAVHRYDASGSLTEVVDLPASNVTSCTLGGPELSTLFITTSRQGVPAGEQPAAGAVFRAEVATPGLPVRPYAG